MAISDAEKANLRLARQEANRRNVLNAVKNFLNKPSTSRKPGPLPVLKLDVQRQAAMVKRQAAPVRITDLRTSRLMQERLRKQEVFEQNRQENILNDRSEYYDGKPRKPSYLERGGFL